MFNKTNMLFSDSLQMTTYYFLDKVFYAMFSTVLT